MDPCLLPLLSDHDPQQLVFQSLRCDHKVEQCHLGGQLREVVRVAQLGRDVEPEVCRVFDCVVTQLDTPDTSWGGGEGGREGGR